MSTVFGQTESSTLSGLITDPQGKPVPGVGVQVTNQDTNLSVQQITNDKGLYVVVGLKPGRYRVSITKDGFRRIDLTDLVLNVQDVLSRNFQLQLGPAETSITVVADEAKLNTTDGTVSTVVDRQFAENLPMNGRSFQTLIQLTPGVVLTPSNGFDSGQFSINGQRASSNYWMVDGVSANIGAGINFNSTPGNGLGGSLGSFSALGGTNSLVSVDAMQEFRLQTSTYAPEFGRTPGGQISIATRSGTNRFHGTVFDYLRNDALDANNWFNGFTNNPPLAKAKERQNDFGGTFSGPILRDRTFFFLSYEGLRLGLPQTAITTVPDATARQSAVAALQPFLKAFPFDPNQPNLGGGIAQFNASFSNPATLDAYSIRVDHKLNSAISIFGRYNFSPSESSQRGGGNSLNTVTPTRVTTQTATGGLSWLIASSVADEFRFNYSRTLAENHSFLDNFGGATPLSSLPFPDPFTADSGLFTFTVSSLRAGTFLVGQNVTNLQQQINVVDNVSIQKGSHSLKVGVDFRRLSPSLTPAPYGQTANFSTMADAQAGTPLAFSVVLFRLTPTFLFRNFALYAQDTWRVVPRLSVTYGLRWDVDFVPERLSGAPFPAVTGFDVTNFSNLALAPAGTPPFDNRYGNFAPRVGAAYQLFQTANWATVVRGGFGAFYDLASSEFGNQVFFGQYPFGASIVRVGGPFPLTSTLAAPPTVVAPTSTNGGVLRSVDPHLQLPYTLQWNAAVEQGIGRNQSISAAYVGAAGKRLLQSIFLTSTSSTLGQAGLLTNTATSDYDALQLQFQRRVSHGLQALASYSWSHSIDTASAGSTFTRSNDLVPGIEPNSNRGASDFDIRHAFSAALTYELPKPKANALASAILGGWSLQSVIQARSAPPVNVFYSRIGNGNLLNALTQVRPDLVAGQPLYLFGSQCAQPRSAGGLGVPCPGGKGLNLNAFAPPTRNAAGNPLRQGNLGRNTLRGFGAAQWDFAVHRDFALHEAVSLQFRAELFNVLNHPNFGQPSGDLFSPTAISAGFGVASQLLGQSLNNANLSGGAFNPLYQIGGPRSVQFGLKLAF